MADVAVAVVVVVVVVVVNVAVFSVVVVVAAVAPPEVDCTCCCGGGGSTTMPYPSLLFEDSSMVVIKFVLRLGTAPDGRLMLVLLTVGESLLLLLLWLQSLPLFRETVWSLRSVTVFTLTLPKLFGSIPTPRCCGVSRWPTRAVGLAAPSELKGDMVRAELVPGVIEGAFSVHSLLQHVSPESSGPMIESQVSTENREVDVAVVAPLSAFETECVFLGRSADRSEAVVATGAGAFGFDAALGAVAVG
mmetsp:Transcript_86041/g.179924  ORF Transcript_86041/g.179924 Transcript_86041/m.179924 type:complete len:247 (-) Transcript_86041:1254-1994(-)